MILTDEERLRIAQEYGLTDGCVLDFALRIEREVAERCAKVCVKLGGGGEELLPAIWQDAILAMIEPEPKEPK